MNWFARALVALHAAGVFTHVSASSGFGPVCGWDCWTPPSPSPKRGTNNTYCANAWNSDGSGYQCLSVGEDQQSFDATSQWTSDPNAVHAYPHVKLGSPLLPIQFQHISSLKIHAEWGLSRNSRPTTSGSSGLSVDATGLAQSQTVANVAYDIWADVDPNLAANESAAGIEIMIWLGVVGPAQPLGWNQHASCGRQALGDARFSLFVGSGPRGQNVFTWMPDTNHTRISQDLSPLLQYLWRHNLVSATAYVGTVAFGSESFHSTNPITFSAQNLSLTITGGEAPNLSFDSSPDTSCKSWSDRNMPGSLLVLVVWVAVVCSIW